MTELVLFCTAGAGTRAVCAELSPAEGSPTAARAESPATRSGTGYGTEPSGGSPAAPGTAAGSA